MNIELPTQILNYLAWLATAGGAGVAVSWLLERIPAFQKLTSTYRQLVSFTAVMAVVLVANALPQLWQSVPFEFQSQLVAFFDLFVRSGLALLAVETFHQATKK